MSTLYYKGRVTIADIKDAWPMFEKLFHDAAVDAVASLAKHMAQQGRCITEYEVDTCIRRAEDDDALDLYVAAHPPMPSFPPQEHNHGQEEENEKG